MAYFVRIIALLLLIAFKSAYAGYAQVSPPPSVVVRGPDTFAKIAANDAVFGRVVVKEAVINVGGQAVKMPAAMRFASNAPRFAARALSLNPIAAVLLSVGVSAWLSQTDITYNDVAKQWEKKSKSQEEYYLYNADYSCYGFTSAEAAAGCYIKEYQKINPTVGVSLGSVSETAGWFTFTVCVPNNGGCLTTSANITKDGPHIRDMGTVYPVSPEVVEEELTPLPMPQTVPKELPKETEFPVEPLPFLNPKMVPRPVGDPLPPNQPNLDPSGKPRPIGDPGVPYEPELDPSGKPQPRPLRVPIGDPVQEPVTETQPDPNKYRQPVIDVVPSPTPDDPWRVDLRPRDIISENPNPMDGPKTVPNPSDSTSTEPAPKTEEKTPGMCDLYPDILACAKPELDTPEADELKTKEIDIQLNPDGGWSTGGGACPPARQLHVANVQFDIKGVCDGLTMLRPVVLAFAWLLAAVIVVGATKKD